jgi:hypothetical protein
MTKTDLWDYIIECNPSFARGPVTLTAAGVRKLYSLAYDHGHDAGVANGRAMERDDNDRQRRANPFSGMFGA